MRKVKVSQLFKAIIYIVTLYILGFDKIIALPGSSFSYEILIAVTGVLLALYVKNKSISNPNLRTQCVALSNYLKVYLIIILIEIMYSMVAYGYSFTQLLIVARKYFYVFYAYPIIYIFSMDNDAHKFINKIYWISMLLLTIKSATWYLYNFRGVTIFSGLLLQYSESWTRNGFIRMDTGALFGVVLCLTLYYCLVKKQVFYWSVLVFLYLYLIFVTQYRFQIIVTIVLTVYCYYCSTASNRKKTIRLMAISFAIIVFVISGGLDYVLNIFSLNGTEGGSTQARLLTIDHYVRVIKEKDAILGVGFLSTYTSKAFEILRRSDIDRFWLEDLGILGGIFTFGITSLALYGKLFSDSIKRTFLSYRVRKSSSNDNVFEKCIVVYMIGSCVLLNIFDAQRIWSVPFYLGIVYFAKNPIKSPSKANEYKGVII